MSVQRTSQQGSSIVGHQGSERTSPSRNVGIYYAVFLDLGKLGLEAVCHPETTRNGVIAKIREGQYSAPIYCIHEVCVGEITRDVTLDLQMEAALLEEANPVATIVRIADHFDAVRNVHAEENASA